MSIALFKYAAPMTFYGLAGRMVPWFAWSSAVLCAVGLYIAFFVAPTDFQQSEAYRVIFIHVPAAWMSMFIYLVMAFWAAVGLAWNTRLSFMMARALAPTGAMFAFLSLWTGALWGKPMWGAWWVWDARLTSELILLFLYLGYIALRSSIEDPQRADRASAVLALVGVINLPIIHYSVVWWNSLHQGSTMFNPGAMSIEMKWPALAMLLGFMLYYGAVLFERLRAEVIRRERNAAWLREELAR